MDVVRFDHEVAKLLADIQGNLFHWLGSFSPSLPEDLCLFRTGADYPSLVSVTHEKDGWVLASEPEVPHWAPPSHFQIQELLIPQGDPDFLGETQSTDPTRPD